MTTKLIEMARGLGVRLGLQRDWYLIVLGAVIGLGAAFGAIGFDYVVERVSELSFERMAAGPVWLLPVVPMVGALGTGLLVHLFAGDAKGHGVPQVMRAVIKRSGVIKPRLAAVKMLASVCTVGTGGSAGVEGPIVQIGAAAGSSLGQVLRVNPEQMRTLVGCGAAAGIASIFNAPIAGVFFVLEILLRDFSIKTFAPVVIASVISAATTQAVLGENEAIFSAQEVLGGYEFGYEELPSYVVLGLVCGVVAVGFGRLLHLAEDVFEEKLRVHPVAKPVIGAGLMGVLGVVFVLGVQGVGTEGVDVAEGPRVEAVEAGENGVHGRDARATSFGEEEEKVGEGGVPFFGNGYATIRSLIDPATYEADGAFTGHGLAATAWVLVGLLVLKVLATSLTLGSGGSGGVFAPALFMGATSGAALGVVLETLGLLPKGGGGGSPAAYALVGMAAVVGASTHAPLTAILMLFELTRDVYVLLPIMLAAVVATVLAQVLDRDSIYTAKLRRAGDLVGLVRDRSVMRTIPVSSCQLVALPDEPVYASDPLSKLIALHAYQSVPDFVVVDANGAYMGMVTGSDMRSALIDREAIPLLLVAELMRTDLPVVGLTDRLDAVMAKFAQHDVSSLAVVRSDGEIEGLLTRAEMLRRYDEVLDQAGE